MSASAPPTVLRATVAASSPAASSTRPSSRRSTSPGARWRRTGRTTTSGAVVPAAVPGARAPRTETRARGGPLMGCSAVMDRVDGPEDYRRDEPGQDPQPGPADDVQREVGAVVHPGEPHQRGQAERHQPPAPGDERRHYGGHGEGD